MHRPPRHLLPCPCLSRLSPSIPGSFCPIWRCSALSSLGLRCCASSHSSWHSTSLVFPRYISVPTSWVGYVMQHLELLVCGSLWRHDPVPQSSTRRQPRYHPAAFPQERFFLFVPFGVAPGYELIVVPWGKSNVRLGGKRQCFCHEC